MNVGRVLEMLKWLRENLYRNLYDEYFFGEWTIPWLPDDL